MLKDLLKEGGLYTIANFLTKGVSLLLIPFYTTYFTPSNYGVIDILALFGSFIINVFMLQLNRGLSRHVAEPSFTIDEKTKYASTAIWTSLFLLVLLSIALTIYQNSIIDFLSGKDRISNLTYNLAVYSIVLNAIFYLLGVYLRSLRKAKQFAIMSFTHALFGILLVLIFVLKFNLGINSIYLSYIVLVPILIIVQLILLKEKIKFTFDFKILKKLLSYSTPLIPASIAIIIMNFSDRIYIKEYLNFSELGIYAIGTKFSSIIGLFITGFTMAITPLIIEKQHEHNTKGELGEIFNLFISLGSLGVLALSIFSKEMIHLFTNEKFYNASDVMPLMFLTSYFIGFAMFSQGLILKKKTFISALLITIFAIINILLNKYLIPVCGISGAALATFISTVSYQLLLLYISRHYLYIPINKNKIFFVSLFHIGLIIVFLQLNLKLNIEGFIIKILFIIFYIIVLLKTNLLNIKSIFKTIIK